jgi:hypothetical protein
MKASAGKQPLGNGIKAKKVKHPPKDPQELHPTEWKTYSIGTLSKK